MAVWQCRLLLSIVLCHLALSSPVVRRDVLALDHEPGPNPLAEALPETLGEDAFGPDLNDRGGREKRLLKTLTIGTLGVKAAKAVGGAALAAGAKAVGAKVLKTGAVVKAAATGAIGLKAKAIGVKTVGAVAALGIKALLFKLIFGLTKSSLLPRRQAVTTPAPDSDDIPEFDPNKISLQVPDELFAPAFNSVNSISTVLGDLIQNTAERVARLVERIKPALRSSFGFRSRKRETINDKENELSENDNETTYFTDSGGDEIQDTAGSETLSTTADDGETVHSPIKTSYSALVHSR